MVIKCVARGFILNNYSYLRNPWNWLDFTVIVSGYLTSFIEMGNLAGLRTFRVLRALKTVAILPSKQFFSYVCTMYTRTTMYYVVRYIVLGCNKGTLSTKNMTTKPTAGAQFKLDLGKK